MQVGSPKRIMIDGIPAIEVEIDGRVARLTPMQKRWLFVEHDLVFLGAKFEQTHVAHLPAGFSLPDDRPQTLRGFTNDPQVVAIYRKFLDDLLQESGV